MNDEYFMSQAIYYAKKAFNFNEVPVGAVVVFDNKIIGKGYNSVNKTKTSSNHAEILAIREANLFINDWRLVGCSIYITLEPCMMCVGAINNCRIQKVVYGAKNHYFGASKYINQKIEVISGILEDECGKILSDFFREIRKKTIS